jgi:para-nitrobenzyl esterase
VRILSLLLALALVGAACNGDTTETADATSTTSTPEVATTTPAPPDPLLVDTTLGPVRGTGSPVDGVRAFLAIPFAEAPVGELAWRPPQPRQPWTEPLDATEPGPACPQAGGGATSAFLLTPDPDGDCLSLNVWSPEGARELPVMVWIHGGGFETGSAHMPYYQGDDLSAEGVVVVSMNYRLGPFGFLATDELAAEDPAGAVGNYGLLDQREALEWVQANAEAFGGDPDNVTIFGESAGGFSVCGHLSASRELFDKAIIQSGGGCDRLTTREEGLAAGQRFLEAVGCPDVTCLRTKPDEELLGAGFDAEMVADGVLLEEPARDLAARGELDDVALLVGSNADEATLFTLGRDEPGDDELVTLAASASDRAEELIARAYPREAFETNLARYQTLFTDVVFACPTLDLAALVPQAYVYHYTYVSAGDPFGLGATHGAEIAGVFAHPEGIAVEIEQDDETRTLSDAIQAAWASFARTGEPGEGFAPYADGGAITLLDVPFEKVGDIRDGRCAVVDELGR